MPRTIVGASRSPQKKRTVKRIASIDAVRSGQRAKEIIDMLLCELQRGVLHPELLTDQTWEALFGSKQSVVANVQKLVAALAALPQEQAASDEESAKVEQPLTPKEMALLTAWLAERDTI